MQIILSPNDSVTAVLGTVATVELRTTVNQ